MFNQEYEIIKLGKIALRIWFICLPFVGCQTMCANFFQVKKAGIPVLIIKKANFFFNFIWIKRHWIRLLFPNRQQPIMSYNYGAKCYERVKETLRYTIIGSTIIALSGFCIIELFPQTIISMFNQEYEIQWWNL